MDSSPVLRQQNQNKISKLLRTNNEQTKMNHLKSPKSATRHSNQDENKDPQKSAAGKKATVGPGVSRLPVLAKSLHLPTPSSFSLSNSKWEEKPLAGKAEKGKTCTRLLPFNRRHGKNSRKAAGNEQPTSVLQSRAGIHSVQQSNAACSVHQPQANGRTNLSKSPHVLRSNAGRSEGKVTENTPQFGRPGGTVDIFKPPAHHLSSIPNNTLDQIGAASSAEACVHNMNQLSIKDLTKTSHTQQSRQLTEQGKSSTNKGESFQPDHATLLSILRNEGVSQPQRVPVKNKQKPAPTAGFMKSVTFTPDAAALQSILQNEGVKAGACVGTTPGNPTCPSGRGTSVYTPQRVPVKNKQKPGPTAGFMRSEPFTPDAAALQSILQNEGVKAGGCVGTTPGNPTRPTGRGTSVYTAQRVPVRKQQAEALRGPATELKESMGMKWTPQRVPVTKHKPTSAMKWHLPKPTTPYCTATPRLQSCNANLMPHQKDVVQRLFDDQEEESSTNVTEKDPEKPVQDTIKSHNEARGEACRAKETEQQRIVGAQPFVQAPQRDSVIFFSTGKNLLRLPRFEGRDVSTVHEQDSAGPSAPRQVLPEQGETTGESEPTSRPAAVQSLHKDNNFPGQKSCSLGSAVAMLRKRLLFEELRLDEEVASYTSVGLSATTGFLPPRPRCGNPLAALFHFEESSRFLPIGLDPSSGPTWPCSLMEER